MKSDIRKAVLAVVVLAVQCVAVGWLIWRYESVVRHGAEVRFRCEAYDPYDPLRGRYLRTAVRESCTNLLARVNGEEWKSTYKAKLFAKLEPGTNGLWKVVAVADAIPASDAAAANAKSLWIKAHSARVERSVTWADRGKDEPWDAFEARRDKSPLVARLSFPDQLFVNERIASAAENVLRDATSAKGKGAVAVYRVKGGEIVITDIEIDGKSVVALARDGGGRKKQ